MRYSFRATVLLFTLIAAPHCAADPPESSELENHLLAPIHVLAPIVEQPEESLRILPDLSQTALADDSDETIVQAGATSILTEAPGADPVVTDSEAEAKGQLLPLEWFDEQPLGVILDDSPCYWMSLPGVSIDRASPEVIQITPQIYCSEGRLYRKTPDEGPVTLLMRKDTDEHGITRSMPVIAAESNVFENHPSIVRYTTVRKGGNWYVYEMGLIQPSGNLSVLAYALVDESHRNQVESFVKRLNNIEPGTAHPGETQEQAIAAIEAWGGTIRWDANHESISVDFKGTQISDAGLEHLKGLTNLRELNFVNNEITDTGIEHLKGLTSLQVLNLINTEVTDAGLEHLKGLTSLRVLQVVGRRITDAGLEQLKELTNLKTLDLSYSQVTDAGLQHLAGLTSLQVLTLSRTQVSDAGLEHLKGLTNLQTLGLALTQVTGSGLEHLMGLTSLHHLDLGGTRVTDGELEHVNGLTSLQTLNLPSTNVTDAGLQHLSRVSNLQRITLRDTHVTDTGVRELQVALPDCRIER